MKKIILSLIALIFIVGLIFWGYWYYMERKREAGLIFYGNVDVRQVDIGFRVAGQVTKLFFEEGDYVCTGQMMAQLDCTPYVSQAIQAQAQAEAIRVSLANAEILLKRRQELIGVEGVSQEDVDNALSSRNTYLANLAASEASHQVARDNVSYTDAFAPTDGVILTRVREPGTVVNPGDPVYTLSVTSPVWIRAYVSEPDLGRICFGMVADIHTDVRHGRVYTGRIGFISPVAEFTPKTVQTTQLRTDLVYRIRIYVDNPDCSLKQGMPVTVMIREDQ